MNRYLLIAPRHHNRPAGSPIAFRSIVLVDAETVAEARELVRQTIDKAVFTARLRDPAAYTIGEYMRVKTANVDAHSDPSIPVEQLEIILVLPEK